MNDDISCSIRRSLFYSWCEDSDIGSTDGETLSAEDVNCFGTRNIHRLFSSLETCVRIRGHFEEYFYDSEGQLTETVDMVPGGVVLNIEKGQWHGLKCLESGTVMVEAKDGEWRPLGRRIFWRCEG